MDLRQAILTADDLRREPVEVPEWGVTVYVRSLTGAELDEYQMAVADAEKKAAERNGHGPILGLRNHRAKLVQIATVDADGKPIFCPGDEVLLGRRNAKAINRVYEKAVELCGLSDEERAEIAKNSESGTDTGSDSVSRSLLDAPLTSLAVDAQPAS